MKSISDLLNRKSTAYIPADDTMLLSLLSMIDVRIKWIENSVQLDSKEVELLEEIKQRRINLLQSKSGNISEDAAWTEAYSLERMMALLEPPDTLLTELRLRLDEAAAEKVPCEPRLRLAFTAAEERALDSSKTPPEIMKTEVHSLRTLLLEILEEIHWTLQRKFHGRPVYKAAVRRIVIAGLISFLLFILPYIMLYLSAYNMEITNNSYFNDRSLYSYTSLPLYASLTSGLFGAYFSRLLYIQQNAGRLSLGELKSARELASIILRGSVGMCGALIVFFFLRSGIVGGELFPNFSQLGLWEGAFSLRDATDYTFPRTTADGSKSIDSLRLILPSPSLALLAIWCFLAGFSERLVPSILSSTEESLDSATKRGSKPS